MEWGIPSSILPGPWLNGLDREKIEGPRFFSTLESNSKDREGGVDPFVPTWLEVRTFRVTDAPEVLRIITTTTPGASLSYKSTELRPT